MLSVAHTQALLGQVRGGQSEEAAALGADGAEKADDDLIELWHTVPQAS